jgi:hypothetical protein
MLASVAATAGSFDLLRDQTTSIIPIMFCISFGFLLCLFGVATLRWISAKELQQYQLHRHLPNPKGRITPDGSSNGAVPSGDTQTEFGNVAVGVDPGRIVYSQPMDPLKEHIRILNMVLALKMRGAAGGRNADMRGAHSFGDSCMSAEVLATSYILNLITAQFLGECYHVLY